DVCSSDLIEVTEAYDEDLDKDDEIFGEEIQELIEHLQDNGITMEDTVEISDSNKDPVKFQLHDIPEEFKIDNLKIYLDDKEIYNNGDVSDEDEIILETDVEGKLAVELKLLLSDYDEHIENFDVYEKQLK